jgi:transposase
MTWKPTHLTRQQKEERRLQAAQLLKAGKLSQAEIARQLDVSRTAVMRWAHQLEASQSLRRRIAPGRPAQTEPHPATGFATTVEARGPCGGLSHRTLDVGAHSILD